MSGDVCGVSCFYKGDIVEKIDKTITNRTLDEGETPERSAVSIIIDHDLDQATFVLPRGTVTTRLPARPFWLVYSNGMFNAGVEIVAREAEIAFD